MTETRRDLYGLLKPHGVLEHRSAGKDTGQHSLLTMSRFPDSSGDPAIGF